MNKDTNPDNETTEEQPLLPFDPPLEERPGWEPPEIERLREENADLQLRLKQQVARAEVTQALKSAGARSPDLLFEAAKTTFQFADDGSVNNAEAVVADLKRKYPEQFLPPVPPSIDGGTGRDASLNTLTKEALGKMKPDEIARLDWAVVREALTN